MLAKKDHQSHGEIAQAALTYLIDATVRICNGSSDPADVLGTVIEALQEVRAEALKKRPGAAP
jgi:hypothetical protein